ncbi:dihydrolipoamide acetyltransferase family protein [Hydrogenibacillus schlegelii]|uniref:Dihydrolipoamide acetyltransferase component of pyruvate dehydrogenase complex n=1 Tax=Hydrogenibacillus schlegelii TaxID=1484 RepID=A0A179ISX6_HYDSH|nr:dihydrolipoamide acetyltransferase family protein [Hydrogenibacillus schlegelii]OAR05333.1 hypothetical protein SA87_08185 [Hydrogenibacillus schlegelii]
MTAGTGGEVALRLHDLGEGLTEAVVLRYFVAVGDRVTIDQPVVEVETDKVTAELPAPTSGIVAAIEAPEGTSVRVGDVLLRIRSDASVPTSGVREADRERVAERLTPAADAPGGKTAEEAKELTKRPVLASPYTRRLARTLGVPLEAVAGSGPAGRIEPEDVRRYADRRAAAIPVLSTRSPATSSPPTPSVTNSPAEEVADRPIAQRPAAGFGSADGEAETLPFRGRREAIARHMVHSVTTIPHVTQLDELEADGLLALKARLDALEPPIPLTAYLIKIVSTALRAHPRFNARLDEAAGIIRLFRHHHIGVAVDAPEGLIVPVIRHVEGRSLREIAVALEDLVQKARTGTLGPKEIAGGTFTISNVGPIGGAYAATPIIRPPEVAILAFHRIRKRPVVDEDDRIVVRSILPVSLSFDHRVLDGADAVRFVETLRSLVREPERLFLSMR